MKSAERHQQRQQFVTALNSMDNAWVRFLQGPSDGRAKLIALSPELKRRLEDFFDHAIELFRDALK